jgi:hypothetical protein
LEHTKDDTDKVGSGEEDKEEMGEEEEIRDDDEEEEKEKSPPQPQKEAEPKEAKHLYANRVKRARKIQELKEEKALAGKRQLRDTSNTESYVLPKGEKDLRIRKRRK